MTGGACEIAKKSKNLNKKHAGQASKQLQSDKLPTPTPQQSKGCSKQPKNKERCQISKAYCDDEITYLLQHFIASHPEVVYLEPILCFDWIGACNAVKDTILDYH